MKIGYFIYLCQHFHQYLQQKLQTFLKYKTKSERVKIKEKIITEIERANNKEKILSERDKEVLSKFFKKIRKELETENK